MPDLSAREWSAVIPLLVLMVWLGVGSQTFLPRIGAVTGTILEKTTENVPFQVRGGCWILDAGCWWPQNVATAPLNQHPTSKIQHPIQEFASVR
jgi:hypothetical protein